MGSGSAGWSRARRSPTGEDTREAILDAAQRLFAERDYIAVRVEDIARESGVSRATFYKHFAERDQILAELFERLVGTGPPVEPQGSGPEERILSVLRAVAERMLEQEMLCRFIYNLPVRHDAILPGGSAAPVAMEVVRAELENAYAADALRTDLPLEVYVEIIGRMFEAAIRDWAEDRVEDPIERLGQLVSVAFNGMSAHESVPETPG